MILTYYQAVELMTFLPVLLSSTDVNANTENVIANQDVADDASGVYQMWNYTSPGLEVNGADFY
ncbi:MAG: hypothetical protein V4592_16750 [Bacteroidota bacterium]